MARFDRDRAGGLPASDDMAGMRAAPPEPPMLTTPRRAMWSAAGMLAIVTVMFVVFYSINSQRAHQATTAATTAQSAGAPAKTATGGTTDPGETTGQR